MDEKLPDLPESHEDFWKEAEKEKITLGADRVCAKGQHSFVRVKQSEAKCQKCPVGFYLPVGGDVRNGNIYIQGELVA